MPVFWVSVAVSCLVITCVVCVLIATVFRHPIDVHGFIISLLGFFLAQAAYDVMRESSWLKVLLLRSVFVFAGFGLAFAAAYLFRRFRMTLGAIFLAALIGLLTGYLEAYSDYVHAGRWYDVFATLGMPGDDITRYHVWGTDIDWQIGEVWERYRHEAALWNALVWAVVTFLIATPICIANRRCPRAIPATR
jgi:hypothetical protein